MERPTFTKGDATELAVTISSLLSLQDRFGKRMEPECHAAIHRASRELVVLHDKVQAADLAWRRLQGDERIRAFLVWEDRGGVFDAQHRLVAWPPASINHGRVILNVDNPEFTPPWNR